MEGRHRAASSSTSRRACHVVHCGGRQVTCIVGCPEADGGHGRIPEGSLPSSKPWDWPPGPDWSRSTSLWFHQPWTSAGQLYPWGTTSPTHSCVVVPGHFHSVPRAHKPPPLFPPFAQTPPWRGQRGEDEIKQVKLHLWTLFKLVPLRLGLRTGVDSQTVCGSMG